jgi:ComF family protein
MRRSSPKASFAIRRHESRRASARTRHTLRGTRALLRPTLTACMVVASSILDVLVPRRCVVCGFGEADVCTSCFSSLRVLRPPLCERCGAPTAWPVGRCAECAGRRLSFRSARAAVAYDGPVRPLVAAWKERGLRRLSETLALLVAETVPPPRVDAVAFVPGDRERSLWRGHNTAEALARELARAWALPLIAPLVRAGRRPRQRGLPRAERRANVRGSFVVRRAVADRLVLVDDVYTTGATVSVAATELRRAGARAVDVVTFARAVRS